jgi:16S rRNA (guanine966-N2)-methyltransferase
VPARGTRPTSERVREALFSAVESAMDLEGTAVLDLYAGSGALGLEALSRGAAHATFVESERAALSVLERNVAAVGLPGAEIRRGRVSTVLAGPVPRRFDLVLADPPYDLGGDELNGVLDRLVEWIAPEAVLVVERAARTEAPEWPEALRPMKVRRYGDTELHWARAGVPEE